MALTHAFRTRFAATAAALAVAGALAVTVPGAADAARSGPTVASRTADRDQVQTARAEKFVEVPGGSTASFSVACPDNFWPTDGGFLLDSVDNGDLSSVFVLSSTSDWDNWYVTIRNDNDGRATGKVKVTCLGDRTVPAADGHTHGFTNPTAEAAGGTVSWGADADDDSSHTFVATCQSDETPVSPAWHFSTGAGVVRSAYASGNTFTWVVDAVEPSTADAWVVCLGNTLTNDGGHAPQLSLTTSTVTHTAPAGVTSEKVLACDSGTGIVGSWQGADAGLLPQGTDPRGQTRMFRFFNDTDADGDVTVGLTCLGNRTVAPAPPASLVITSENDGAIKDPGTSAARVIVRITCTVKCTITAKLARDGALAYGKATLAANTPTRVKLPVKAGRRNNIGTWANLTVTSGSTKLEKVITLS